MVDVVDMVKGALDIADRIIEMRSARQARAAVDELRAAHAREAVDGLAEIERIRASAGLGPAPDLLGVRRPTQGRWSPGAPTWETPAAEDHDAAWPSAEGSGSATVDEDLGAREHVESAPREAARIFEAELVDNSGDESSPTDAPTILDATIIDATIIDATIIDATIIDATIIEAVEVVEVVEADRADAVAAADAEATPAAVAVDTERIEVLAVAAPATDTTAAPAAEAAEAAVDKEPTADVESPPTASEAPNWVLVDTSSADLDEAANNAAADAAAAVVADRDFEPAAVDPAAVEPAAIEPPCEAAEVVALARLAPPSPAAPAPPRPDIELRNALMEAEAARGRPAEARRLYEVVLGTAARPMARFPETLYAALALQGTSECDAELGDLDAAMANSGDAFAWAQRAHAEHPSEETLQVLALTAQAHAQISERASDRPQFIEVVTGCLAVIEPALARRECLAARQIQLGLRSRLLTMTRPKSYIRKGAVTPASLTLTTLQGVRR